MSDSFWADPYPVYHRLRNLGAVLWDDSIEAWLITGADAADAVLRSSAVSSRWEVLGMAGADADPERTALDDYLGKWFMLADDPEHRRLRLQVSSWFTRRSLERIRPQLMAAVRDRLELLDRAEIEVVSELAAPLAATAVATLLGFAEPQCRAALPQLEALASFLAHPDRPEGAAAAGQALAALHPLVDPGTVRPGSPLAELARQAPTGYLPTATLLLFAGQETTIGLLGTSILHLVRAGPVGELAGGRLEIADLVTELLRLDTPVPQVARVATADFELGGERIRAGDRILVSLAAANRDPEWFPDPDELSCPRDRSNLGFGAGAHFCLGALLARVVAEELLTGWVARFPDAELAPQGVRWITDRGYRGLAELRVRTGRPR